MMTTSAIPPRGVSSASVTVCIVAWKGADLTIDCLRSLAAVMPELPNWRVVVIDNASPDDSARRVEDTIQQQGWAEWATLIRSPRNGGFAAGNNLAIRHALSLRHSDFYLLLNPDTVVRPGALQILLDFMQRHPTVGIAGGRSEHPDATPQHCCFRFPNPVSELSSYLHLGLFDRLCAPFLTRIGIPDAPTRVDWVSGAFMMVRAQVIDEIGLMDEGYFLYFEETDFTLRARRAGWECWHIPTSRVVHLVGQSSGVSSLKRELAPRPAYWFESRRRYFTLNHGRFYAFLADISALLGIALARVRRAIERKPGADPPHFLRDFIKHGAILNGRRSLKPRLTTL
jgi:N-acetylglucosaminyl-diphospho-decaprenol L-rhamnosyltransferase